MGFTKFVTVIFGLMLFAQLSSHHQVLAADNISYIAAVVEYQPITTGTNGTILATANARNYVTIIQRAANSGADIIVFPENSLTTGRTETVTNRTLYPEFSSFVPAPYTDVPCNNSSTVVIEALQLISCATRNYSIYVVVNLDEKVNCTGQGTAARPCPSDGYFFYNTNVAFNRTGGIVSRYRKWNLFGEAGMNVTATPEIATFTTDFNVTFGQIICFDILFKTPTLTLVEEYNVTDIVFSTHWFSELPYLTAVQTQSAWSYANNVNLLASGYNRPATGSGGSGIYAGTNGSLITLWSENSTNTILIARVPKVINGTRNPIANSTAYPLSYTFNDTEITTLVNATIVSQQALLRDNLTAFTTSFLPLINGTTVNSTQICDRGLCCSFDVNRTVNTSLIDSNSSYYRHRIAVFNGVRSHSGVATTGIQICSIISCTDDSLASCGLRFALSANVVRPTVFNGIVISGNFSNSSTTIQMPDSLTNSFLPLNVTEFSYTKTIIPGTSSTNVVFNLTNSTSDLLTFAIYRRNFTCDGSSETRSNTDNKNATNTTISSALEFSQFSMITTLLLAVSLTLFITSKV